MKIGHFKRVKKIGQGAFGETFIFEHEILGVKACVKRELRQEEPYMTLFREEAAIIAKLRHPSLPSFMDYKEYPKPIGQLLFLSYIEGEALDKTIEMKMNDDGEITIGKPIDDEHICWIIDRLLGAVSYLHGKWNIVHCDIKPANIILDVPDHNATLVDLGMAALKPQEFSQAKGGTRGFLPPEFAAGLPPIPASDIYSIGKIACCLAGGDVLKGEFPADMEEKLKEFFSPWLRYDPTKRPQNADELRYELAVLRKNIWKRSTCREQFKFR
ncbi:hypothetical protein COT97_03285 [Candidatus Falkowbacteria bacterium CG10_big_fil_rev_8_21_14_0_10_39_11]|uniref:non-specific serine/threonine protein kinase n=1 Tax=Candidatus Falkowbacteria bacterium CG10_big_fil_rev_8_21_14_0_10_39_11 TaxID=1974565 RepID=A0A2H0V4S2_9BACT|nr:MAG: hypothetical protein COT97_03285 [Candidatus Falkowbacteria bacterium CG10_big_fil_rev_8_21_14_0_10_39_11]